MTDREPDGLRAKVEALVVEWRAAIALVGTPDQDVELVVEDLAALLAAHPAADQEAGHE